jgi:multidrug efflux system outer membrane protein
VARSLFFPDVSLTGAFGSASTALGAALHGRDSKLASLGPKVDLAIFSGGALRANRDAALARQEQAVIAYHQTVSAAFAEVATDLHAIRNSAEVREIQTRRSESAVEARRLAELRFHAGTTSFMELLDAQRQVLASQSDLIQAELAERQARIDLYLALGGGWLNSP